MTDGMPFRRRLNVLIALSTAFPEELLADRHDLDHEDAAQS